MVFSYSYLLSGNAFSFHLHSADLPKHAFFFIDKNLFMSSWELYDYDICFVFFQELLLLNTSFIFTCIKKHKSKSKFLTSFMHNLVQIASIQKRIIDSFLIPCEFIEPLNLLNGLRQALLAVRKPAGVR